MENEGDNAGENQIKFNGDLYNLLETQLVDTTGFTTSDLIIAPAPFLYEVDQTFILRSRLNDPLSEVSRVAFYGNGVELNRVGLHLRWSKHNGL